MTTAKYTYPELTREQHYALLNALEAAGDYARGRIEGDPVYKEFLEDLDPPVSEWRSIIWKLHRNPNLLPDQTSAGSDTSAIKHWVREIKSYEELRCMLISLLPHK